MKCPKCGKIFGSEKRLKIHYKTHEKKELKNKTQNKVHIYLILTNLIFHKLCKNSKTILVKRLGLYVKSVKTRKFTLIP